MIAKARRAMTGEGGILGERCRDFGGLAFGGGSRGRRYTAIVDGNGRFYTRKSTDDG
jgi:hypothetical protein